MKVTTVWCGLPDTGAQPSSGDVRSLVTQEARETVHCGRVLGNGSQFDSPTGGKPSRIRHHSRIRMKRGLFLRSDQGRGSAEPDCERR
jgi:hypothetical protein